MSTYTVYELAKMNGLPEPVREALVAMNDKLIEKDAALQAALPALIRLGDFVGNVDEGGASGMGRIDRCAVIRQVQAAITSPANAV